MNIPSSQDLSDRAKSGFLYYVIPAHIYEDENLLSDEVLFYALISNLSNRSGFCYASNQWLAKKRKVDIRTIQRWIEKLEDLKYIKREMNSENGKTMRYISILTPPPMTRVSPPMTQMSCPHDMAVTPPHDTDVTLVIEEKVIEESNPPPTPSEPNRGSFSHPGGGVVSDSLSKKEASPRGNIKEGCKKEMRKAFGNELGDDVFEAAWAEVKQMPVEEVKNLNGLMKHKIDKYLEWGVPKNAELDEKARMVRIDRHRAIARQMEGIGGDFRIDVKEHCVYFIGPRGSHPIGYDCTDEEFARQTGFHIASYS